MNDVEAVLMKFITEQKDLCNEETRKLIQQDAPKNKFSVVTGKFLAYEAMEEEITNLERQRAKS